MPTKPATKTSVQYPTRKAEVRDKNHKDGPISCDEMKEVLGWTEELEGEDWKKDFVLKDMYGRKIRLANNPDNRNFSLTIAERYSEEFLAKKWECNLESFIISKTGKIRSGQHRGVGFILAEQKRQINPKKYGSKKLEYETLVAYGAEDSKSVKDSYDKGRSRDLKDVLFGRGVGGKKLGAKDRQRLSSVLSGALKLVWTRVGGKTVSGAGHFPHSVALEFYDQHKGINESAVRILELEEGREKLISQHISLAYAVGLYYLMYQIDPIKTDEFWASLSSGAGLEKDDPVLTLSKWAVNAKAGSASERDEKVGCFIKAFNAFHTGEKLTAKQLHLKKKREKVLVGEEEVVKVVINEFPYLGGLDVGKEAVQQMEEEAHSELTVKELLILKAIKGSKEATYASIAEQVNQTSGAVSKLVNGTVPTSLSNRGLVAITEREPEEGEKVATHVLELTKDGAASI